MKAVKLPVETLIELAKSIPGAHNIKGHALETVSFELECFCFNLHYAFLTRAVEATVYDPYTDTIRITDELAKNLERMARAVNMVQTAIDKHNALIVK